MCVVIKVVAGRYGLKPPEVLFSDRELILHQARFVYNLVPATFCWEWSLILRFKGVFFPGVHSLGD